MTWPKKIAWDAWASLAEECAWWALVFWVWKYETQGDAQHWIILLVILARARAGRKK